MPDQPLSWQRLAMRSAWGGLIPCVGVSGQTYAVVAIVGPVSVRDYEAGAGACKQSAAAARGGAVFDPAVARALQTQAVGQPAAALAAAGRDPHLGTVHDVDQRGVWRLGDIGLGHIRPVPDQMQLLDARAVGTLEHQGRAVAVPVEAGQRGGVAICSLGGRAGQGHAGWYAQRGAAAVAAGGQLDALAGAGVGQGRDYGLPAAGGGAADAGLVVGLAIGVAIGGHGSCCLGRGPWAIENRKGW